MSTPFSNKHWGKDRQAWRQKTLFSRLTTKLSVKENLFAAQSVRRAAFFNGGVVMLNLDYFDN
jgi:hypothetical protein